MFIYLFIEWIAESAGFDLIVLIMTDADMGDAGVPSLNAVFHSPPSLWQITHHTITQPSLFLLYSI